MKLQKQTMIIVDTPTKLQMFGDKEVRSVLNTKTKEVWLVAKDIADILEYSQTQKMTTLIKNKYKCKLSPNLGDISNISTIRNGSVLVNERGLYQILSSTQSEIAEPFQDFLFDELLPNIRENGYYISNEAKLNPSDKLIEESKGILATRLGIDNTRDELIAHINEYLKEEAWNPHSLPNALSNCYQHLHIATKGMIASQVLEEEIRTSPEGLQLTNWRQKRKLPKIYSADYGVAQNYYTDEELLKFNNRFIMILQRVVTHIQLYPKLTPMTVLALIKKASRDMVYETSMHVAGEQFKGKNGKKIRKLLKQFVKDEIEFQEIDLLLSNITLGNKFTLGES